MSSAVTTAAVPTVGAAVAGLSWWAAAMLAACQASAGQCVGLSTLAARAGLAGLSEDTAVDAMAELSWAGLVRYEHAQAPLLVLATPDRARTLAPADLSLSF